MTTRDPVAFWIGEAYELIGQIGEAEHEITEARRARDTRARKDAENKAHGLRRQLLERGAASSSYLYLSATDAADSKGFRTEWQQRSRPVDESDVLRQWAVEKFFREHWSQSEINLTPLPAYSFTLDFTFTLAQPYMSKDDNQFYIIDNPIVRDRVFRLPIVRPSSWKGSLRAALWQLGHRDDDPVLQRLFGKVNEAEDEGQAGRLFFYPTFFTRTDLEIINPHDRVGRVGKNPILFESVPIAATGRFTLLYIPFDQVGANGGETARQVVADLPVLTKGLRAMFCLYGFGAKTSSGFGLTREAVREGALTLRTAGLPATPEPPQATEATPDPPLPRYLEAPGRLHADLRAADGSLVPEEEYRKRIKSRGQKYAKKDRQLYDKAKAWWQREGKGLAQESAEPEAPVLPEAPTPTWPSWPFVSFEELVSRAEQVAQQLTQGGAQ